MSTDVACFRWPAGQTSPALQQLSDANGGTTAVGSAQLAQRVIIELLTERDSQAYGGRGTVFLTRLRAGGYTEMDILVAFSSVKNVMRANLQNEERPTDDPAERYLDSYVDQIVVTPEAVQLRLNIKSRAGLTTVVVLPALTFGYH